MEGQSSTTSIKIEGQPPRSAVPNPTSAPGYAPQHVQNNTTEEPLEHIEQKLQSAVSTLEVLNESLTKAKDDRQAALFLDRGKDLLHKAPIPQTIIGVVGSTGSGKSSVINAVLKEECLVPVSFMRACTAVVTEISWNYSNDPDEMYRAEIEFLTIEEWDRELELFYGGLVDCSDNSSGDSSSDAKDAGVAWEKMRAVYPQYTKQGLTNASAKELSSLPEICNVTGTTRRITATSSKSLHDQLLQYIDSKGKGTETSSAAKSNVKLEEEDQKDDLVRAMEFWPMIKVVRVFTKSDALSTGAIIVDLPGVHDSNAARAAVADKYIQRCSNIWIVAPIHRAVDDKTAQNLLGRSFRTQLRYDGAESQITFVCTKIDVLSTKEVTKALRLEQDVEDHDRELHKIEAQRAEAAMKREELLQEKKDRSFAKNEIGERIRDWKKMRRQLTGGRVVYAPKYTPRKRKRKQPQPPRQKSFYVCDPASDDLSSEDSMTDGSDDEDDGNDSLGEPLTKEQIEQELDRLQVAESDIRERVTIIKKEVMGLRTRDKDLARERKWPANRLRFVCMRARNERVRESLQQQYAAGIREMDEEAADQGNEDLVVPEQAPRDYNEVAKSLRVFCVSSWDYQKAPQIHGEGGVPPDIDVWKETEVPELQQHTKRLTEENRKRHCRRFMAKFLPTLQALEVWSHERKVHITEDEKKVEADWINGNLVTVKQELEEYVVRLMVDCRKIMDQYLFSKEDSIVQRAVNAAANTARAWGEKDDEGQSLRWVTYKAICRHAGDFTGRLGRKDFNQELVQPLLEDMRGPWEHLFRNEVPDALKSFPPKAGKVIQDFDGEVRKRISAHPSLSSIEMGGVTIQWYIENIKEMTEDFGENIATLQKETSRQFEPSIAASMRSAYAACVDESWRGSFARMKSTLYQHVLHSRKDMLREPLKAARSQLIEKCINAEKSFLLKVESMVCGLKTEYYQDISAQDLSTTSKTARAAVSQILADNEFMRNH